MSPEERATQIVSALTLIGVNHPHWDRYHEFVLHHLNAVADGRQEALEILESLSLDPLNPLCAKATSLLNRLTPTPEQSKEHG